MFKKISIIILLKYNINGYTFIHLYIYSVFNKAEVLAVVKYVTTLLGTNFGKRKLTQKDIGIITPFKQQQLEIIHRLALIRQENIAVGTVETFQGQEKTVIILSTVRSKIFNHDGVEHIGFLSNPKVYVTLIIKT